MWVQLAVFVVLAIISYALMPKAPGVAPASLEEITVPQINEGTPIAVVFGTVVVQGPNIVWYGDLAYEAIESSGGK